MRTRLHTLPQHSETNAPQVDSVALCVMAHVQSCRELFAALEHQGHRIENGENNFGTMVLHPVGLRVPMLCNLAGIPWNDTDPRTLDTAVRGILEEPAEQLQHMPPADAERFAAWAAEERALRAAIAEGEQEILARADAEELARIVGNMPLLYAYQREELRAQRVVFQSLRYAVCTQRMSFWHIIEMTR